MRARHWEEMTTTIGTFLFILFCFTCSAMGSVAKDENKRSILNKVHSLQISFIENKGQIKDKSVKYYAKTFGGTVFITRDGKIVYSLPKFEEERKVEGWVLREGFEGASISNMVGQEETVTKISYFKGKDPSNWKKNLSTYKLVNLGEVYRGIELKLKAYGNNVEKLFYVKPKANPESIKVKMEGAKSIKVNEKGELEIETGIGTIRFTKPIAYQEKRHLLPFLGEGKGIFRIQDRQFVEVAYVVKGDEYGFKIGDYDRTKELVIDPLLASTFLGGTYDDYATSISIDSSGNVYVAGSTISIDFPTTPGAYDTTFDGNSIVFVSKFDSNLENLLASTFIGNATSSDLSIATDSNGNVYVAGSTTSSDFPTTDSAYDTTYNNGENAFVSKFDSNLENLLASTFLGDGICDTYGVIYNSRRVVSISMDSNGNVYVAGCTSSSGFPTTDGVYDTSYNYGGTAFVSKFDSNLENLLASTFLGGMEGKDGVASIATDSNGNVYVAGSTTSSDFPTTDSAYDTTYNNGENAFVSKFDSNLENLLASTFISGTYDDYGTSIFLDNSENVYIAGVTFSIDFPTTSSAYDCTYNGYEDVFVSKLDNNLATLLASTYLGGSERYGGDQCLFTTLDSSGNVYVAGHTHSPDFPTTLGVYNRTLTEGITIAFISKLNSNLGDLLASTFLGGGQYLHPDKAYSIALDSNGNVYVAGSTQSEYFPTTSGSYDTSFNGGLLADGFISKFDSDLSSGTGGPENGYLATSDLWIRAVINTEEKGAIEAVWKKGGEDTTSRGDRVIWGHFYASPSDVTWGSENNPDLFVKIWFDVSGRVDVNYFHVSVPGIEVYSDYPYDGTQNQQGTTSMSRRYIRQYYENGQSNSDENYEDGNPPSGYSPTGNPFGYSTINDLRIGAMINTVEKGPIDAVWRLGGQDTTSRGDQVVWGHFYASPNDVTWGSQDNPDLFVKIWFDVSGRVDVNFFHVSVPDIEVYSDLPDDSNYDQKGTTVMDNRYIRHEY